ncbi:hypothetical protein [uncultured Acetobacteroides sp.]|uniref:hypothetical protein n=1 Tax=uncultured Acetobacteroides sp. TaxID=1760811 RepID=UPI0029F522F9|nr:hypothetical protein [uncultured Acetobacteroides sp.]
MLAWGDDEWNVWEEEGASPSQEALLHEEASSYHISSLHYEVSPLHRGFTPCSGMAPFQGFVVVICETGNTPLPDEEFV